MKLSKAFGSLFLLAVLTFVPSVFAGGGGVDTRVTNTDDPHANTVLVYFDPKLFTCKGMNVSFNFETPEAGDMIEGTNGNNTSTITEDAWMAKTHLKCFTYAKVYSKELKWNRILNISFKGANLEGSRKIAVSFGVTYNPNDLPLLAWESSSDPTPIPTPSDSNPTQPSATINAWLLRQQFLGKNRREVTVKWGAFSGYPGTFTIYAKAATNKNDWEEKFDGSKGPSMTFNLRADQDYHLKVNGCMDKWGTCVDSNILTLPKLQKQDGKVVIPENPNPTISPVPTVDNNQVEQLNKKVENLQDQLDQSKKTQSVLEQRINDLVNFIKRLFPFFK